MGSPQLLQLVQQTNEPMFASVFQNSNLTSYIEQNTSDPWEGTSFEGYVYMSPKQKGEFGERFVSEYFKLMGSEVKRAKTSTAGHDRVVDEILTEIKFSLATRNKKGGTNTDSFIINHVSRDKDWERLVFFGINSDESQARLFFFTKADFLFHLNQEDCLFAHQQGGKSIENDDYICTKVAQLIQQDWVQSITAW